MDWGHNSSRMLFVWSIWKCMTCSTSSTSTLSKTVMCGPGSKMFYFGHSSPSTTCLLMGSMGLCQAPNGYEMFTTHSLRSICKTSINTMLCSPMRYTHSTITTSSRSILHRLMVNEFLLPCSNEKGICNLVATKSHS